MTILVSIESPGIDYIAAVPRGALTNGVTNSICGGKSYISDIF